MVDESFSNRGEEANSLEFMIFFFHQYISIDEIEKNFINRK